MKRGKIVQYDGAKGTGIVVVDGQQMAFEITQWRGNDAPALNRLVEVVDEAGSVLSVSPISEAAVLKEQTQAVQQQVQARGKAIYAQVVETYGLPSAIAYVIFVVATYLLTFVTVKVFMASNAMTLSQLVTQFGAMGKTSLLGLLFWLALLAPIIPFFIKTRLAWLGLVVPAVLVLFAGYQIWSEYRSSIESMREIRSAMSMLGGGSSGSSVSFSDIMSLGFGFYLSLLASVFLARVGIQRYRAQ